VRGCRIDRQLWKDLPPEKRLAAATAFWVGDEDETAGCQIRAIALSKRLTSVSMQALSVERRAKQLSWATFPMRWPRALVSCRFADERPLMAAFTLDAVGVKHENGLIAEEEIAPPASGFACRGDRQGRLSQCRHPVFEDAGGPRHDTWATKGLLTPSS
jgi:hypothetical protein